MTPALARDIIKVLPRGRTLFYYFEDRYAALLLEQAAREELAQGHLRIADLRKSSFGKVLERSALKKLIAAKGDGRLTRGDLETLWPVKPECYRLTLGIWGAETRSQWARHYHQTTRPGHNLVLQLNFSTAHDVRFRKLIDPNNEQPFTLRAHPVAGRGKMTLAWARIDLDLDTGEALIEEIQSDWVRFVRRCRELARAHPYSQTSIAGTTVDNRNLQVYIEDVFARHMALWDEAMLAAAVWFLAHELGLRRIFMHDFDCGVRLKQMSSAPPRSLYRELPSKFCFGKSAEAPEFLMREPTLSMRRLMRKDALAFWRLDLDQALARP